MSLASLTAKLLETRARGRLEGPLQALLGTCRAGDDEANIQLAHWSLRDDRRQSLRSGLDVDDARLGNAERHDLDQHYQLALAHKRVIAQRGQRDAGVNVVQHGQRRHV